jgi:hypothetical protein
MRAAKAFRHFRKLSRNQLYHGGYDGYEQHQAEHARETDAYIQKIVARFFVYVLSRVVHV